jgi:hypothetical protein
LVFHSCDPRALQREIWALTTLVARLKQLVLRAFFLCRLQHQLHLWDSAQQSLEPVTGDPGTVRHTEGTARGTFVLFHRLGGLENEELAEAMDKPFGILNAVDSHLGGAVHRTHPHTKCVRCFAPNREVVTGSFIS